MLLDTSGLLCMHHEGKKLHEEACDAFLKAPLLLIHNLILAEFVALLNARRLPRQPALNFVEALVHNQDIEVIWVDDSLHERAMSLLQNRLDKTYSLCDAVSFVIMRERDIIDALTTDHHFEQEGFRKVLG
jgi:predicted nucleic acid-binding protein